MTLLQGPTNQTKHDMISPEILKAGVHLHLLEWHDALVVQQNTKAPWKKRRATQRSTSEWKIAQQTTSFRVQKHSNTGNHSGGSNSVFTRQPRRFALEVKELKQRSHSLGFFNSSS